MNEWPVTVWASISAMTAALVLSLIVVLGSLARESAAIQQENDNAVAIVQEHRRFGQFDGTTDLLPQDIITAIAESRGAPEIWVDVEAGIGENFSYQWTTSTPSGQFTTQYLTTDGLFPLSAKYDATLIKDENGSIARIEFRRQ